MREVGVISPGKAVSEEPHLRVLTTLSHAYVSSPFGDYGKAAQIACRHGSCPSRCRSTQARRQTHVERISQSPDGRSALAFATHPQGGVVKVTVLAERRATRPIASDALCGKSVPLRQCNRASLLVNLPGDEMPLLIEMILDLGVN